MIPYSAWRTRQNERGSLSSVSSMFMCVAGNEHCVLVLIVFDASVDKQAHGLENQVPIIDSIIQFIGCEVMYPLKTLLRVFHGSFPPLGDFVKVCNWPLLHFY